ncbi:MAG: metallophosphoesterase family protein [Flavobacteriales bacterium]|nr:metallophosphoesterase family protein [Flavobacteriales bacterium]
MLDIHFDATNHAFHDTADLSFHRVDRYRAGRSDRSLQRHLEILVGYGDGDEATVVSYGPSSTSKYVTTYFRHTFTIADINAFSGFLLKLKKDDGAVVYVNGTEIVRANMSQGTVSYTTGAYAAIGGSEENLRFEQIFLKNTFVTGSNTIAVEVHQDVVTSSDLSFELELTGLDAAPTIHRGPYIHIVTPTSAVIKWKTDVPTNSRVRYGTIAGSLTQNADDATMSVEHEVTVSGLVASTSYFYSIGTTSTELAGNTPNHFFKTHPQQSSMAPFRIWAIGDAGTTTADQVRVRDSYATYTTGQKADMWLMLGDNAYWQGREMEYQEGIFKIYGDQLRNTELWPAPGNHDYYSGANASSNNGPYFDVFALPKLAQAGGVPSNTEAYYSFDYGKVHFICIDSDGSPRAIGGTMYNWLVSDLAYAQANSEWIIAYFHHPPYTKGTHNSDSDAQLTEMRTNFVPLLEQNGVDLVLNGHSHVYERSFLIDNHIGLSSTFNPVTMKLDGGNGSSAPYVKPGDLPPHMGTVYTVCGVSGKKGTGTLNHPAMFMSTGAYWGSLLIDIDGLTLTTKFLNDVGAVIDQFTIQKQIAVNIKVMLEGAYDSGTGLMRDDLRVAGLVPLAQPYTGVFTFTGEGGNEIVSPSVLAVIGNNAIVDWILVELRDAVTPTTILRTRVGLLQRDGDVVDVDGISPLRFKMNPGNFRVAVRHRNHLGAMTLAPVTIGTTPVGIDFTSITTTMWGIEATKNVSGVMALWSGDVLRDGVVQYTGLNNDRDPILVAVGSTNPNSTINGYLPTDVNMSGTVLYTGQGNDRDPILVNIGSVVPNNTRVEQLP